MSRNRHIIVGHLGQDPESRFAASGLQITTFSVATTEKPKNKPEETDWHNVVTFGRTAEACADVLRKGQKVYVEGRSRTRKWQDKEGRDRWTTELLADWVEFLSGERSNRSQSPLTSEDDALSGDNGTTNDPDDDIPF